MNIEQLIVFAGESVVRWSVAHGLNIILVLLVAWIVSKFIDSFFTGVVRRAVRPDAHESKEAERKREDTLIGVFSTTSHALIWVITGIMVLAEAGVNVGPIVAAAGVVGLALGFGGQYLIKDIIAGLFIIFENQYRVGDVVCVGKTCGLVEHINLRLTILRDLDGTVHYIQSGEIREAANLSKKFARVNLNVGVSYAADIDHVEAVINRVGEELAVDPKWKEFITSAPKFIRIDDFADSAVVIKIVGDTAPLKQWDVTGELRRRLKKAFDKEGIEIPFPQRVTHQAK